MRARQLDESQLVQTKKSRYTGCVGDVYGLWTVIDTQTFTLPNGKGTVYIKCKCMGCQKVEQYVNVQFLKRYKYGGCRSCCRKSTNDVGSSNSNWKGVGDLPMSYVHNIRNAVMRRGLDWKLTPEYMWELFVQQNQRCSLSGQQLTFRPQSVVRTGTASLDRIDRTRGYEVGNVQWVHKVVNEMKWAKTDEEFIRWCKLVADHNKE